MSCPSALNPEGILQAELSATRRRHRTQRPLYELPLGRALENALVVTLLVLVCLIVLAEANPFTRTLGRDSGMYAYIASRLLQGQTLYLAVSENRPPGIFFIDAMALWLGHGTRWGIWLVEFSLLLGAAVVGFYALRELLGKARRFLRLCCGYQA